MPKNDKAEGPPEALRPYIFHGVGLDIRGGHGTGDCPFCGREGKFTANEESGLWQCFVCGAHGNATTFLRQLWEVSDKNTTDYSSLQNDRKLLDDATLMYWGISQSIITGHWMVPGYGVDGKLNQLYVYLPDVKRPGKRILFPTPGQYHQIHGMGAWDPSKPFVYILEGPWDGAAFWEVLRISKLSGPKGQLVVTASEASSLLAKSNVLAVPGCGSIGEPFRHWLPLLSGKSVRLMFDSDHPRVHPVTKQPVESAGFAATKRAVEILATAPHPPSDVQWLKWGEAGFDPNLPSGTDVRDFLSGGKTGNEFGAAERVGKMCELLRKISPLPESWPAAGTRATVGGAPDVKPLECRSWKELLAAWEDALYMTDGLRIGLACSIACIISTPSIGEQLWMKLIGPPSTGKTTICEALCVARDRTYPLDTLRGFHSGYPDPKTGENVSLIIKLAGKTLVMKDGDPLLQAPNKLQILSEARGIYDTNSRSDYRNGMGMSHEGTRMTWILAGTQSLRELDASELGARFFDVQIMDKIDEAMEKKVLRLVARRAFKNMTQVGGKDPSSNVDGAMGKAMRMTGGYISYLCENVHRLFEELEVPSEAIEDKVGSCAVFVAYLRARPSEYNEETKGEREFGARLTSQFSRLASCLAVVYNKKKIDKDVFATVNKVALDTARGRTMEIVDQLYKAGTTGKSVHGLMIMTGETEDAMENLLQFLATIGGAEFYFKKTSNGQKTSHRLWRLTSRLRTLYKEVAT